MRLCFFVFVAWYVAQHVSSEKKHFSTEARLISYLLQNYSAQVRPSWSSKNATVVNTTLNLKQIIDLNEKEGQLTTSFYMIYKWKDERLSWNEKDFDNITLIRLPANTIWTPNIILTNTVDENMQEAVLVNLLVDNAGNIEWMPPFLSKTSCTIKVVHFPFDKQRCDLRFKSVGYSSREVRLALPEKKVAIDQNEFVPHGEWDLVGQPARVYYPDADEENGGRGSNEPDEALFSLVSKRKPLFYTLNMLTPCMLVTVLSCFTFYLPSASCEKISLGISLLVGDTIFIFLFAQRMPSTSFSIPLIAAYLLYTMVLLSVCVVSSTFVLSIHWRSNSSHKMPNWLKEFVFVYVKYVAGMRKTSHGKKDLFGRAFKENPNCFDKTNGFSNVKNTKDKLSSDQFFSQEGRRFGLAARHRPSSRIGESHQRDKKQASDGAAVPPIEVTLQAPVPFRDSLHKIHTIGDILKREHLDKIGQEEWVQIADILDRALMWVYLIFFTFGTLAFYIYAMVLQSEIHHEPEQK